ncbi:hypothetical protein A1F94_013412 [Pyrenophora tritici-repentis]|uniref:Uncharacterized protein n=1 Tax=Pyrenophora tritici-repentis TaxID=45151 RepID=A0A5M9LBY8_9PLEO|nr:hypothetical protein PtrV1_05431 [Pyrenophora tritici-repentis]KAF7450175.1 hypothetical protein A1F99_047910 [Pyrenophora tritici-repentis]KAF7572743.1 hypothetical protein PtrM4_076480 [Pyrenophora tritici-repentis]KAG9376146.1 hypothetical protein A1F94_013412 [Pyrenophora tritici-repentis]KAI0578706.1 hypothetical protein Alg130_07837 [Pyrenophora tritici-repentis]
MAQKSSKLGRGRRGTANRTDSDRKNAKSDEDELAPEQPGSHG